MHFNLDPQGDEKIKFFFQETYEFQILGNESLIIAGYEDTKTSIFQ